MIAADYPFLDVFWSMFIFFVFLRGSRCSSGCSETSFVVHDLSGGGKTGWLIFMILLPFLGVFIYMITENEGMAQREIERAHARQSSNSTIKCVRRRAPGARRISRGRSNCSTAVRSRRGVRRTQRRHWRKPACKALSGFMRGGA